MDPKTPYVIPHPSWGQKEQLTAMDRHLSKLPFDVVMRGVYICDTSRGTYDVSRVTAMRMIWQAYGSNTAYSNGLRASGWSGAISDFPWQDYRRVRAKLTERRFFDAYRRRSSFYIPWDAKPFIMTVEALASIWHPPSRAIAAPGLQRIPSTKSEPPPNLPM